MNNLLESKDEFLQRAVAAVEENLADENFGVSEMAERLNMSRSNLLRKIKSQVGISASVFIRQVRLEHSKIYLTDKSLTISEISYKVGFNSPSYFIKCFREHYGYPPGEESKQIVREEKQGDTKQKFGKPLLIGLSLLLLASISILLFFKRPDSRKALEKSIAVLPFKNDSPDSSNVYIVNGLMEAILNNLQKVEDLRVISRTSSEKYRNQNKSIPEIAKELGVSYFVEGSGQKVGDQLMLTVQLIEASSDDHLWSERYLRNTADIFELQADVSKSIASQVEAIVTPEEVARIDKTLTDNLEAYELYLQGLEYLNGFDDVYKSVDYFKNAIELDQEFAAAYAHVGIAYYYLDLFQANKLYGEEINSYADKAMLLDPDLGESLIAKALFYMQDEQYDLAIEYLEKVLVYYPNSGWTHNFLSDIYNTRIPNTEKYLIHALKGIQLDIGSQDSSVTSYSYLHLGNALVQNGFVDEAEFYIKKSLAYDSANLFSGYLYAFILLAQDKDFERTKKMLIEAYNKDSSRLDMLQEIAKIDYSFGRYEESIRRYEEFIAMRDAFDLNIFHTEDIKIGFVLEQLGRKEEAKKFYESFKTYADSDESIYRDLHLSVYYILQNQPELAIESFREFSNKRNYQYWIVLFLEDDPILQLISDHKDFDAIIDNIKTTFWEDHNKLRDLLTAEGLL